MANQFKIQKLVDNNKRAVIKIIGILDSAQTNTVIVQGSTLAYALNANGKIIQSNTHPRDTYGLAIRRIWGDIKINNGYLKLQWQDDANSEIAILSSGSKDIEMFGRSGDSSTLVPPAGIGNNKGNILLSTFGSVANDTITLMIDIRKDGSSYDQGQTAMPQDFNR